MKVEQERRAWEHPCIQTPERFRRVHDPRDELPPRAPLWTRLVRALRVK